MSRSKFASVTAELLSRKGQARPWLPPEPALHAAPPQIVPLEPEEDGAAGEPAPEVHVVHEMRRERYVKRCSLRLSPCEYQRLGILAVKRNLTRQQVLRYAIEEYLAAIEMEFGDSCGCLAGHECTSKLWDRQSPSS